MGGKNQGKIRLGHPGHVLNVGTGRDPLPDPDLDLSKNRGAPPISISTQPDPILSRYYPPRDILSMVGSYPHLIFLPHRTFWPS